MNWGFSPALLWTQERMTWHSRLHLVHPINWRETPGRKKTVASLSPLLTLTTSLFFVQHHRSPLNHELIWLVLAPLTKPFLGQFGPNWWAPTHRQCLFWTSYITKYSVTSLKDPLLFFCKNFPLDNIRPYWEWLQYIMACALSKINIWGKLLVSSYIFDMSVSNINGLCLNIWF